jgi:4'-phosphopantetheinyl transferase
VTTGVESGLASRPAPGPAAPDHALVHVWRRSLDREAVDETDLAALLSRDERLRAERFRSRRDASRFIVARATLRQILGAYLAVAPDRLVFVTGPHGKPALAWPRASLTFSVSHCEGLALYAIARGRRVGVDVERRRPVDDLDDLAARVFAASERAELAALSAERRGQAFLDGWTRKEAFVKALGEGLRYPLDTVVVSLDPAAPARLLAVGDRGGAVSGWSLHALDAGAGYAAALAAEGQVPPPTCWNWTA